MSTRPVPSTMSVSHRDPNPAAPWVWALAARSVERIEPAAVTRWLSVCEGRVWLTRTAATGEQGAPEDDLWLFAGDRAEIAPGTEWLVEAWPAARLTLLEEHPAPAPVRATLSATWRRAWRALAGTTLQSGPLAA